MTLPKIFIGSTKESIYLVEALYDNLREIAEVTPWHTGVFQGGNYTMEDLSKQLELNDFGVFIFSPDDVVLSRSEAQGSPRDNVIFELGLFMGKLGRERAFFIIPQSLPEDKGIEILIPVNEDFIEPSRQYMERDGQKYEVKKVKSIKIPSDLYGITPLKYDLRTDGNWDPAFISVKRQIQAKIKAIGKKKNDSEIIADLQDVIHQKEEVLAQKQGEVNLIKRLLRFVNQAKQTPVVVIDEDYDKLLYALRVSTESHPFTIKGITLFREEGLYMVQKGKDGNVGEHGKAFQIHPSHSERINVVESFKSGEDSFYKKSRLDGEWDAEYLVSIPLADKYVVTFHLYGMIEESESEELAVVFDEFLTSNKHLLVSLARILKGDA